MTSAERERGLPVISCVVSLTKDERKLFDKQVSVSGQ